MLLAIDVIELASFAILVLMALVWWVCASVRRLWHLLTRTP